MALDTDQMNQLLYDAIDGKNKPSIPGAEAAGYFKKMQKQVAEMKKNGIMPMPVRD